MGLVTAMTDVTGSMVVDFFRCLVPFYTSEVVVIGARPRVSGCPFRACMGWDGKAQRWVILVGTDLEPKRLLQSLFHELRHVMELETMPRASRGDATDELVVRRAMMDGRETPGAGRVRRKVADSIGIPSNLAHEDKIEAWATARAEGWWGTLATWAPDVKKAGDVARWVYQSLKSQNAWRE